jgi:hypothetical protein
VAAIGTTQDRSPVVPLTSEIRFLVNGSRYISFVKVDRSKNRVSRSLANFATSN